MGEAIVVNLRKNDPQLLWELDVGVCGVATRQGVIVCYFVRVG